jgi:amino acid transporter
MGKIPPSGRLSSGVGLSEPDTGFWEKLRQKVIGKPRDIREPSLFHKISLIPILAWVGLGADGLSSSSYGPEEAFRTLGAHTYLAILLALATALTVSVIAYTYSKIIEHFPHGGGGYIVATHTIGKDVGVISGAALLVDYMLTITVSLASSGDALFSFLPASVHSYKLPFVAFLVVALVVINIRGVKESVIVLAPIFLVFVVTHILLIGSGLVTHASNISLVAHRFHLSFYQDVASIGYVGILALFLRAFSMGAGTYTGIEAVSNGMQILREPRVQTGKRTMLYMAVSLTLTAAGLLCCYALFDIKPLPGRTLNAILADSTFFDWPFGGLLALVTLLSEGALLVVAAQAGFVDGPRVMANMATDSWLPRRFSALSERLTMQNGIVLMGFSAFALLLYTEGSVSALVVMYSINVFLTFSLSQFGMVRMFLKNKDSEPRWKKYVAIHTFGLLLCLTILCVTIFEKFTEGGWVTVVITSTLIGLCYSIKGHYLRTGKALRELEQDMANVPSGSRATDAPADPTKRTAILLVGGYNGFGLHTWLSILRAFPGVYKNFIFVSVAEVDSGSFKGTSEIEALRDSVREGLARYVNLCRSYGFPADFRMDLGTDVVEAATRLCESLSKEFPESTVFAGQLIFRQERFFQRILHNQTAFAIQRRLQWEGITAVILPIRINHL